MDPGEKSFWSRDGPERRFDMEKLPLSLSIALWACGSTCLVGAVAYAFNLSGAIVACVFLVGLITALIEWILTMSAKGL